MAKRLTIYITVALVLGIVLGWGLNAAIDNGSPAAQTELKRIADGFGLITTIFLRLIRMIIAPLVLSTLVVGIAQMGDPGALGRIGGRALGWFVGASLFSLGLGLLLYHLLQPGAGLHLALPAMGAAGAVTATGFDPDKFIAHVVPASIVEAMAANDILPIVVFALFAGIAITSVGERAAPLVRGAEALAAVMLRVTDHVMRLAPVAVFAAVVGALAEHGPGLILGLGYFIASVYLGLVLLWLALIGIGRLIVGPRMLRLVRHVREPALVALSTASSEAAFPRTLEALDRFGVPPRIASFVLPLGYSFNLDGSMMYMTFASLFIARAYGVQLSLGAEIGMLLLLMLTSKGVAGVPRASLVVIAANLSTFGLPAEGVALVLAIDHFLDMGRSATNVLGNAVAATVVARWEGGLDPEAPPERELPAPATAFDAQADSLEAPAAR